MPFIPKRKHPRRIFTYLYSIRGGGCLGKVAAMNKSKYSYAAGRNWQKHSGVIPSPLFLSLQTCFPFNQRPPFSTQMLQRQWGECNKMRPIHPQSCVCTLRGSAVVHTSTEEWQLPGPQILSVCQVIDQGELTVARITFQDEEIKKREGKERYTTCIRLFIGRIPVMGTGCVAWWPVDWLTGVVFWKRGIRSRRCSMFHCSWKR